MISVSGVALLGKIPKPHCARAYIRWMRWIIGVGCRAKGTAFRRTQWALAIWMLKNIVRINVSDELLSI